MASKTLRPHVRGKINLAILFGTTSLAAIAGATAAYGAAAPAAAAAAESPVEEVLVTGSIIRGAPAVGVPVTALGSEDFERRGSITIADMLKEVPGVNVVDTVNNVQTSGGNRQRLQATTIHGISSGNNVFILLMIDSHRYPGQGTNLQNVDPSLVPQLALDRVDVLAAGASATYGSDAVSGVINLVLKHRYDGAISRASTGVSTDLGWKYANFEASQLYGRTWDTGGVDFTYEWRDQRTFIGAGRDYYTKDFTPWGFDNRIPLSHSIPAIISLGAPAVTGLPYGLPAAGSTAVAPSTGDRYCGNCYNLPKGLGWDYGTQAPGPTTTWAAVLANPLVPGTGTTSGNQRDFYDFAEFGPSMQNNNAVLTFDQDIAEDVWGTGAKLAMFAEGFYQLRRTMIVQPPGESPSGGSATGAAGQVVPTTNPYIPLGAPATIRVNYTTDPEFRPYANDGIKSGQYAFGFNATNLPFEWEANLFFSTSEEKSWNYISNIVNSNMLAAAMGNTIASVAAAGTAPARTAYTKPASIPYLNVFCDSVVHQHCNSIATFNWLKGFRHDDTTFSERELGFTADGPIVDIAALGETIRGAVGYQILRKRWFESDNANDTTYNKEIYATTQFAERVNNWAVYGQLNVPLVAERNKFIGVEALTVEVGYRLDRYEDFGDVYTPKIQANWTVGWGLLFRYAYGTAFNTPGFAQISDYEGAGQLVGQHTLYNVPGSTAGAFNLNCPAHNNAVPNPILNGTVSAGSLQAYLNPGRVGCPANAAAGLAAGPADPFAGTFQSVANPIGVKEGGSLTFLQGVELQPEKTSQYSYGFNFTPRESYGFVNLTGLAIDVEYYNVKRTNLIGSIAPGQGANDPLSLNLANQLNPYLNRYLVIPRPDLALTAPENATFKAFIDNLIASGRSAMDPAAIPFIKFVDVSSTGNQNGWTRRAGFDWSIRYDWDLGDLGAMNARASGNFTVENKSRSAPGAPITSSYTYLRYDGRLVGANSGSQMSDIRLALGWTDPDAHWNTSITADYKLHTIGGSSPPACYWRNDFGPGTANGLCYPGAPYWPQPFYQSPTGTDQPTQRFGGTFHPAEVFFDVGVSYNTAGEPAQAFLQNIRVGLNINNIMNRLPSSLYYDPRVASGSSRIRQGDNSQRTVNFSITKAW